MKKDHFVGRPDVAKRLAEVLARKTTMEGTLAIQSIEGPGGIGKTCLFDHVLKTTDTSHQKYLILRIDGNAQPENIMDAVSLIVEGAKADAIKSKTSGHSFPQVSRVTKAKKEMDNAVLMAYEKQYPSDTNGLKLVQKCLAHAYATAKSVNETLPASKRTVVNLPELEAVEQWLDTSGILLEESQGWAERMELFGIGEDKRLRNSIKKNPCVPLSSALISDLSAILLTTGARSWGKGIDRLLLILDDYEKLQGLWEDFLLKYFLPALQGAGFESTVVILGRDKLEATHPAWDQHLKSNLLESISLNPLLRQEMDALVESFGVTSDSEKDRAWRDTEGYPYYVQLWIEEAMAGGRSAVMLKRFYDRTTRWMTDDERKKNWLHHALFIEDVNVRSLRHMLGDEAEAREANDWFQKEGSIRDTNAPTFRVREYLRSRLVAYLRASDPDLCEKLESRSRMLPNPTTDQSAMGLSSSKPTGGSR